MSQRRAGDWIDETYCLERVAGQGAMGQVWRAHDRISNRPVALKLVSPQVNAGIREYWMFIQEARVLARFHHQGIVHAYAMGLDGASPYMALEWVEGESFQNLLHPEASIEKIFACLASVIDAISHVHSRGVVHRDLKPSNILIQSIQSPYAATSWGVKLLDFGVSKIQEIYGESLLDSSTLGLLDRVSLWDLEPQGTPRYMPPEVYRGSQGLVSPASDMYSLGVLLFEVLSGKRIFDEISNDVAVVLKQSRGEIPECLMRPCLSKLRSPQFLLRRMLDPDPFTRPQSIAELRRELRDWFHACVREDDSCTELEPFARALWSDQDVLEMPTSPLWDLGQARCVPEARLMSWRILPLVGRVHEQAALWKSLETTRKEESFGICLLQGNSVLETRRVARWAAQTCSERGRARVVWSLLSQYDGWGRACAEAIQKSLYADPKTLQSQDVLRSSLLELGQRPWALQDSFTTLPGRSIESILAQDPQREGILSGVVPALQRRSQGVYNSDDAHILTSFLDLDDISQEALSNVRAELDRIFEEAGHVSSLGTLAEQLCILESSLCADVFWCIALQGVRKGHLGQIYSIFAKIFGSISSHRRLSALRRIASFAAYTYRGYGALKNVGEPYLRPFRVEFVIALVRERMQRTGECTRDVARAFVSYSATISSNEGFVWILDGLDMIPHEDRSFLGEVLTWFRDAQREYQCPFYILLLCEPGFSLEEHHAQDLGVQTIVLSPVSGPDILGFVNRYRVLPQEARDSIERSAPYDLEEAHEAIHKEFRRSIPVPEHIDLLRSLHAQSPWERRVSSDDEALWLQVLALRDLSHFGDAAFALLKLAACLGEFVSFRVLMSAWQHHTFDVVRGDVSDVLSKAWEFWVQHGVWIQESPRKIFFRESSLRERCLTEVRSDASTWNAWNRALAETYRSLKLPTTPQESIDFARFCTHSFEVVKGLKMGILSAERFEERGEIAHAWRSFQFCVDQVSSSPELRTRCLEGLARTSLILGDRACARPCIDELVRSGRESGDLLRAARGAVLLGELCVLEGRTQEAYACFERAQGWFDAVSEPVESSYASLRAADLYLTQGDIGAAEKCVYMSTSHTLRGHEHENIFGEIEISWSFIAALSGNRTMSDELWSRHEARATRKESALQVLCQEAKIRLVSGQVDRAWALSEEGLVRSCAVGYGSGVFEYALVGSIAALVQSDLEKARVLMDVAREWSLCAGELARLELELVELCYGVMSETPGSVEAACSALWGDVSQRLERFGLMSWKVGWVFACLASYGDALAAHDEEIRDWVEQQASWYVRVFPCRLLLSPLG